MANLIHSDLFDRLSASLCYVRQKETVDGVLQFQSRLFTSYIYSSLTRKEISFVLFPRSDHTVIPRIAYSCSKWLRCLFFEILFPIEIFASMSDHRFRIYILTSQNYSHLFYDYIVVFTSERFDCHVDHMWPVTISPVTPRWSLMTGVLELLTIIKIEWKLIVRAFWM